jgi:hypothetical protein
MPSNLAFIKHRLRLKLQGAVDQTGGSDVFVYWTEVTGGSADPVTGAVVGGVETPVSGVLRAFGAEEPARTVLRQFSEIKAGDLILDIDPDGLVNLFPQQVLADGHQLSGTITLDNIADKGVRFEWGGQVYDQAQVGEELARAWNVIIGNQRLGRTLLLRRAT